MVTQSAVLLDFLSAENAQIYESLVNKTMSAGTMLLTFWVRVGFGVGLELLGSAVSTGAGVEGEAVGAHIS